MEKTPTRAALTCAQRSPGLLRVRALQVPQSSSLPLSRHVGRLDTLTRAVAVFGRPRHPREARRSVGVYPFPPASRPTVELSGRTTIPSSLTIPIILGDAQTTRLSACYADACLPTSLVLDRPPPSSSNGDPGAETAPVAELSVSSTSGV